MRSDSVKNMSAYADQNHAPSLAAARLDCRKLKKGKVMAEIMEQVQKELASVIIGKKEVTDKILMAFLSRGHILLEDVPGVGKTTTALGLSKILGLEFRRIQFTPDVVPSDVTGFTMYNKENGQFQYHPGAVMCNMLLADEINRTSSKTQSALLEVMEEGNVTVDGVTYEVPKPFVVIATQNPLGTAGTQMLPESQLDRFMVRLSMGYPDVKSQVELLRDRQKTNPLDSVRKILDTDKILEMQQETDNVYISDPILEYISVLTDQTRKNQGIVLGVSPRGALALSRMSKARAYLSGRDYVIPEDIQEVWTDVCAHRIVLSPKARISDLTAVGVLTQILKNIEAPRVE